jgi:hypothetical protein
MHIQELIGNKVTTTTKRAFGGPWPEKRGKICVELTGRGLTCFTVHCTYETYFRDNITLFGSAFGFLAVILTAMQVLVGISQIPGALVTVCYRFSVAVLVLICVCFGYIGLVFFSLFLYNYVVTLFAHAKS